MTEQPSEDPRQSYTSASNAEPDLLCPGRHLAQRGLPGYDTRESQSGTIVHAAFAGTLGEDALSSSQKKTVRRGRELEEHIVEQWFRSVGCGLDQDGDIPKQIARRAHRELRLWAYHNGQKVHSGGIDALWLAGDMKFALVEDLKSLFGDVGDAASNQQLRDYAALVYLNYGCETVSVFINQPNVNWKYEDQKLVTYSGENLRISAQEMRDRVLASNRLNSPRYPGLKQCAFCLACGTSKCPESLEAIKGYGYEASWVYWDPVERGHMINQTKAVKQLAESALDVAKAELKKDPAWADGWKVTEDQNVRSVESVDDAALALMDAYGGRKFSAGVISEMVTKRCKLSVGDLEELHSELSEAETAEDRRAEFNVLFGHLIKTTIRSGSLKKVN